ncbi:mge1 [[Candida] subhashii]|uniref:GrpE protein homolog, mitochondrial n=1 Tax=[Candida] subhashii TaxID=561895 RepID=A0A8J5QIA1_9ASCO|nr:mge1 [[Candida] subhashii]KAG7661815.1 mge1 [[Candida] subhashii]
MQRALLSSLTRSVAARNTARSMRVVRPVVAIPSCYQPFAVRFNSTNAAKEEPVKTEEEAKTEEPAKEEQEQAAEEAKEVDPTVELQEKLLKKDKELAEMKNHYARAIADFRHLQETTKKEVQKAKDFALQKFAKDLLESLDNFALALGHVKPETLETNHEVKNLYEGVDMTRNIFEKTLGKHGIEKIDAIDKEFDPNLHEATFQVPQPEKEPGTVFFVQQDGYTLNSRVLRPAKVGIVKGDS